MKIYENQRFLKRKLIIDGAVFRGCTLENCELQYTGGVIPMFQHNNMVNCRWTFAGEAMNTLTFVTNLYHGGAMEMVEKMIENIRAGKHPQAIL